MNIASYYPLSLEVKIINMVVNGSVGSIKESMDLLIKENETRRFLSGKMILLFKDSLEITFYKIADQLGIEELIDSVSPDWDKAGTVNEIIARFQKIIEGE